MHVWISVAWLSLLSWVRAFVVCRHFGLHAEHYPWLVKLVQGQTEARPGFTVTVQSSVRQPECTRQFFHIRAVAGHMLGGLADVDFIRQSVYFVTHEIAHQSVFSRFCDRCSRCSNRNDNTLCRRPLCC